MIYTAVCKQFKEKKFERFCGEQKRGFHTPFIGKHTAYRCPVAGMD